MRILITNQSLWFRSGTETYVRDLATGLLRRGCEPLVYSPQLGEVADELVAAGVPVIDDLAQAPWAPDVIHGHHTLETSAAICRFPQAPAVFVCHDVTAWHDTPPKFAQVRRYIAVDKGTSERLIEQHGVPSERVSVLRNTVDLERFQPRESLPERPRRALLFSNYAGPTEFKVVKKACDARGIALDAVGASFGKCSDPERLLRQYDLVFAAGRSAMEAMAVGAAVVLCSASGCGPLVTPDVLHTLQTSLAGRTALDQPVRSDILLAQIDRYDAADAEKVSRRIRETRPLDFLLDQLLALYHDVRAEPIDASPTDTSTVASYEFAWWAQHWGKMLAEARRGTLRVDAELTSCDSVDDAGFAVKFDRPMRGGWLPPEFDGYCWFCWMGPGLEAEVVLNVPNPGRHRLRFHVPHVVEPSILDDLAIEVNGYPVTCLRLPNPHGIEFVGKVAAIAFDSAEGRVRLAFRVAKTARPCDVNSQSSDLRNLSIAVSELTLTPDTGRDAISTHFRPRWRRAVNRLLRRVG